MQAAPVIGLRASLVFLTLIASSQACWGGGGSTPTWSAWSGWSACNATCQQQRTRTCTGGTTCPGPDSESQFCSGDNCPSVRINGNWSPWGPYSECSASCGGGTKTRTRTCTDPAPFNAGAPCVGDDTETTECNKHACSQCSAACSGTYTNCVCKCTGKTLIVEVMDSVTMLPVYGAKVFTDTNLAVPLATTNTSGIANYTDICVDGLSLTITCRGYRDTYSYVDTNSPAGTASVTIVRITYPKFAMHPQPMAAYVGANVTLSCRATSNTGTMQYQWYFNGNKINVTTTPLELTNVQASNAGEYQCRVSNGHHNVFSNAAKLVVSSSSGDTCPSAPQSKFVPLTRGCTVTVTVNNGHVDVGVCPSAPCLASPNSTAIKCCGATAVQEVAVTCIDPNKNYKLYKVTTCGCRACSQGTKVTVRGKVNKAYNKTSQIADYFYNGYTESTNNNGWLILEVPAENTRLPLKFVYNSYYQWATQLKPFKYNSQNGEVSEIWLRNQSTFVEKFGNVYNTFTLNKTSGTVLATVGVPANSTFDDHSQLVTTTVRFHVDFVDTFYALNDQKLGFQSAPGDYGLTMEDGRKGYAQSCAIVRLHAANSQGQSLFINSLIPVAFKYDEYGITVNSTTNNTGVQLWKLDEASGYWSDPVEFQVSAAPYANASMIVSGDTWLLIGRRIPGSQSCKAAVKVYTDETLTAVAPNVLVTSYNVLPPDPQYISQASVFSDINGLACVPVPCDNDEIQVTAKSGTSGYFKAAALQNLPPDVTYQGFNDKLTFVTKTQTTIPNALGPIYPAYAPPGFSCESPPPNSSFFKMHANPNVEFGQRFASNPVYGNPLSWNRYESSDSQNRACFVKIRVQSTVAVANTVQVISTSTKQNKTGDHYGTYISGMVEEPGLNATYYSCVEFKCPGETFDLSSSTTQKNITTYLNIQLHTNATCNVSDIIEYVDPATTPGTIPTTVQQSMTYKAKSASSIEVLVTDAYFTATSGGTESGVMVGTGAQQEAYTAAYAQCFNSQDVLATFSCS